MPKTTSNNNKTNIKTNIKRNTNENKKDKPKPSVIKCENFEIKKLTLEKFDENIPANKSGPQIMTFPKYEYDGNNKKNPVVVTGEIQLTQHGLASYKKDDNTPIVYHDFFKIPYDESQPACVEFFEILEQIDDVGRRLSEPKNKKFNGDCRLPELKKDKNGKCMQTWKYSSLIRNPQDETNKRGEPNMRYCKVKYDLSFPDKEFLTSVFERVDDVPMPVVGLEKPEDMKDYLKWKCKVRFIISIGKLWAQKVAQDDIRKYGFGMKCLQMEITEKNNDTTTKNDFQKYAFGGDGNVSSSDSDSDGSTSSSSSGSGSESQNESGSASDNNSNDNSEQDGSGEDDSAANNSENDNNDNSGQDESGVEENENTPENSSGESSSEKDNKKSKKVVNKLKHEQRSKNKSKNKH